MTSNMERQRHIRIVASRSQQVEILPIAKMSFWGKRWSVYRTIREHMLQRHSPGSSLCIVSTMDGQSIKEFSNFSKLNMSSYDVFFFFNKWRNWKLPNSGYCVFCGKGTRSAERTLTLIIWMIYMFSKILISLSFQETEIELKQLNEKNGIY